MIRNRRGYDLFKLLTIFFTPNHIRAQMTCYHFRRIRSDMYQQHDLVFIRCADTSQNDRIRFDCEVVQDSNTIYTIQLSNLHINFGRYCLIKMFLWVTHDLRTTGNVDCKNNDTELTFWRCRIKTSRGEEREILTIFWNIWRWSGPNLRLETVARRHLKLPHFSR